MTSDLPPFSLRPAPTTYRGPFVQQNLQETQKRATALADILNPGDLVLLEGPMGAGKTAFARFLTQHLAGADTIVQSPTFPLLLTYDSPRGAIAHADLWRLDPENVGRLGLEDMYANHITLIEWPDRLKELPPAPLWLWFSVVEPEIGESESDTTRQFYWSGDTTWQNRLKPLGL